MKLNKEIKKQFSEEGKKGADIRWKDVVARKKEIMAQLYEGRDRDLMNWLTTGKSLEWLERFLKYANKK